MANGNPPAGLPGGQILAVVMAAPTDIFSLATRQLQESMNAFSAGVQKFSVAAAQAVAAPPIPIPGTTGMPLAFPGFPGFPGAAGVAAAAPPAPTPGPAEKTTTVYGGTQAMPLYKVTVQT